MPGPREILSMPIRKTPLFCLILLALWFAALQLGAQPSPSPLSLAVISDAPYTPQEEANFPALIEDINHDPGITLVVHIGDFKNGGTTPCSDEVFLQVRQWFDLFQRPLIYTPGDNEWTDCHRWGLGEYDPSERLSRLREIFFPSEESLGRKTIPLARQSRTPTYGKFRENARWVADGTVFSTLHIVGSNNNLGRTPADDAEHRERIDATLHWMREAFALARSEKLDGVVLIMHADPYFEKRHGEKSGFRSFLLELEREVVAFKKPVLLIHGDTHTFRVDHPLRQQNHGRRVENFTRLESFGSPRMNWVKVTIDRRGPDFFKIEPRYFTASLPDELPTP